MQALERGGTVRPGFLVEWKIDSELKFGIVQEVTTTDGGDIRVKTPEGETYWMSKSAPTRVWSPEREPHLVSSIAAAVERAPDKLKQLMRETDVLIWSFEHKSWWAPNERGYTTSIINAGTYPLKRAIEICTQANGFGKINEAIVPRTFLFGEVV